MFVSRVIRAPFSTVALAAASDSPETFIRFREPGWVTGLMVGTGAGDGVAGRTALALKVVDDKSRSIFLDGSRKATFVTFDNLAPITSPGRGMASLPLVRRVRPGETWYLTARNMSAATAYVPQAAVAFVSEKDWHASLGVARGCVDVELPVPPPSYSSLPPVTRVLALDVATLAAGIASPYALVEYPDECMVLGVRAAAVDNSLQRADVALEVYDSDCEQSLTTVQDGINADFVPLGLCAIGPELVMPMLSRRNADGHHRVRVKNIGAGNLISQVAFLLHERGWS